MSAFGDFVKAFSAVKGDLGIPSGLSETRRYGWRFGTSARTEFMKALDEIDDVDDALRANFNRMFEVGGDLQGLPVVGFLNGKHASELHLLRVVEQTVNVTLPGVAWRELTNLTADGKRLRVRCPVTGGLFDWTCSLKINSVKISDRSERYADELTGDYLGTITNVSPEREMRRVVSVDAFGLVDYRTGDLRLIRESDENIELLDELIKFVKTVAASGGSSGASGGGGGPTWSGPPLKLETDTFTVTVTRYAQPATVLWSYSL